MWAAFLNGLILSLGLIVAIGPQNAYVVRKGLRKRHVFLVTTMCFLSDAVLITAGATGVGALLQEGGLVSNIITLGGVIFLAWYGAKSFRDAFKVRVLSKDAIEMAGEQAKGKGWTMVVLAVLAFTYLNPHVYIDTLVILGGVASRYELEPRIYFTGGAILASAIWFYGLGYGAGFFSKTFENPKAWKILDGLIGLIMWSAAAYLAWDHFGTFIENALERGGHI